jgi:glucose/mannose-6-phosphate isomerase
MDLGKIVDLDNPTSYRDLDRDDMLGKIGDFPSMCQKAWEMAEAFPLPAKFSEIDKIVILGMGGSAIGGDLVGSLVLDAARVPVSVCRGYALPEFVDARTLVIASSYSGNTEETLACFEQSLATGARKLAITSGGRLAEMAQSRGVPVFRYNYDSPPRAALPFSFMPLLCFMGRIGLLKENSGSVAEDIRSSLRGVQDAVGEDVPISRNKAKQLAADLHGRLAVVYGAETVSEVAHRWKTQINENSQAWCFYESFPEMNHNAVVGYSFPAALNGGVMVLMLSSSFLSPRVRVRYEVVSRLLKAAGIAFRVVGGAGGKPAGEMMSLVLLGDYVSYYLALLNGVDPSPVTAIDFLKAELAKTQTV